MASSTAEIATNVITFKVSDSDMAFIRQQVKAGVSSSESEYVHDLLAQAMQQAQSGVSAHAPSIAHPTPEWIESQRKQSQQWWDSLSEQRRKEVLALIEEGIEDVENGRVEEWKPAEFRKEMMDLFEAARRQRA